MTQQQQQHCSLCNANSIQSKLYKPCSCDDKPSYCRGCLIKHIRINPKSHGQYNWLVDTNSISEELCKGCGTTYIMIKYFKTQRIQSRNRFVIGGVLLSSVVGYLAMAAGYISHNDRDYNPLELGLGICMFVILFVTLLSASYGNESKLPDVICIHK